MPNLKYDSNKTGKLVLLLKKGFLAKYCKNRNSVYKQSSNFQKAKKCKNVAVSKAPSSPIPTKGHCKAMKRVASACVQFTIGGVPLPRVRGEIVFLIMLPVK